MKKLLILAVCNLLALGLYAQLTVSKIYSDHAVIQRDMDVPVWGTASAGSEISINFNDQRSTTTADENGHWKSILPRQKTGGPYTLIISSGSKTKTFEDLLVGDVWLCSGQSNMEWLVKNSNNAEQEIANAKDAQIRHFKVPLTYNANPQDTLVGGSWDSCSPETIGNFTAVGYFFAKNLREHHDIPIGLLNSSWGGSRIEPWMRAEALGYKNVKEYAAKIQQHSDSINNGIKTTLLAKLGKLPTEDMGMKNEKAFWASADYNDRNWKKMALPNLWESQGYEMLDGVVWFRKEIYLTKAELSSDMKLSLVAIDDTDITYFNGEKIGNTESYNAKRNYKVPANLLKAGINILAVRVVDTGGGGGIYGQCEEFYYKSAKGKKSLCGDWYFKVGRVDLNTTKSPNQIPTLLYNQMIHPILDFPIKGAIWYQGESNASISGAKDYQEQFPTMIKDWRKLWNAKEFPFLWVQLANWQAISKQPTDTGWARLREAQSMTLVTPKTAQAVIIDIGETEDIHPRNKQDVGYRLSLGARKIAYGENLVYSGPVYKSMIAEGDKIRLSFELFGSQLKAKNGELMEFAIAGVDKKFYWGQAKIEGDEIIVWSDKVSNPVAVRYAWANNPIKANLYNMDGLPASPFRTDNWEKSKE